MRIIDLRDALGLLILHYLDMSPKLIARSLRLDLEDTYDLLVDLLSEGDLGRMPIQISNLSFASEQVEEHFGFSQDRAWTVSWHVLKEIFNIYVDATEKNKIEEKVSLGQDGHSRAVDQMCEWVRSHHEECDLYVRADRHPTSRTPSDCDRSESRDERSISSRNDRSHSPQYRPTHERTFTSHIDSQFDISLPESGLKDHVKETARTRAALIATPVPHISSRNYMPSPKSIERESSQITPKRSRETPGANSFERKCDFCSRRTFKSIEARKYHVKFACTMNPVAESNKQKKREQNAVTSKLRRRSARSEKLAAVPEVNMALDTALKRNQVGNEKRSESNDNRPPVIASAIEGRTTPIRTRSKTSTLFSLSAQQEQPIPPPSIDGPAGSIAQTEATEPSVSAVTSSRLSRQQWESLGILAKFLGKNAEEVRTRVEKHIDVQCHFGLDGDHRQHLGLLLSFVETEPTEANKETLRDLILLYCEEGRKQDWQRRIYRYFFSYGDEPRWVVLLDRFLSL